MLYRKSREHLKDAGERYGEHMLFALRIAFRLQIAALAVVLHALVPAVFTKTGSGTIKAMYNDIQERTRAHHGR